MALAQVGPLTATFEAFAAAIGAGIVLGGFVGGVSGLVAKWGVQEFERKTLHAGYLGGVAGALAVLADLIANYIV
jgi:hypothetical protein